MNTQSDKARVLITQDSFLSSNARNLVVFVSSDGGIYDATLLRAKPVYPHSFEEYIEACRIGLEIGDVYMSPVKTVTAGLGAKTRPAERIMFVCVSSSMRNEIGQVALNLGLDGLQKTLEGLYQTYPLGRVAVLGNALCVHSDAQEVNCALIQTLKERLEMHPARLVNFDVHVPRSLKLSA